MTTDPSPTAEATRLTEPARTSPTANSPGTEVSNAPWVVTKPLSSSPTPTLCSQVVRGIAPIIRNSPPAVNPTSRCWRPSRHVRWVSRSSPRRGQLRPGMDGDPSMMDEPLCEIARHGLGEVVAADEDVDAVGLPCEEQGGLARRVGAAHHDHLLTDARACLDLGGGVVDAAPLEVGDPGDRRQPAVSDATGDDHGAGRNVASSSSRIRNPSGVRDNPVTDRGETSRTPNLTACSSADRASSLPATPRGKPR